MGTFVALLVVVALLWVGYFGYQLVLGRRLSEPVQRTVPTHPTIVIQHLVMAAASRGWGTALEGTTVVAKHGTGARVLVSVTPAGQGSLLTGSISGVRRGSFAAIKTYKGGQALLSKRSTLMSAE